MLPVLRRRGTLKPNRILRHITTKTSPALITVAITGDVHTKVRNINVPCTPEEQIESCVKSFQAGARVVHLHVRDDKGMCTWDPIRYGQVLNGLKEKCPEMIVEFSLGNYAPTVDDRVACLKHRPQYASLCPGSVNFKSSRPGENIAKDFLNSHEDIDYLCKTMLEYDVKPHVAIFDLSMIYNTADLVRRGLIKLPVRLMYVMGGHMALEARETLVDFLVSESEFSFGKGNFIWSLVGVGWNHMSAINWALARGGHPRTGFEDTLMISRGKFAQSNEQLVQHVADICTQKFNRPIATPEQAREIWVG